MLHAVPRPSQLSMLHAVYNIEKMGGSGGGLEASDHLDATDNYSASQRTAR